MTWATNNEDDERFIDAQRMAQEHPLTFEVPSPDELASICPGSCVKVCSLPERFWVTVTAVNADGSLTGTVANALIFTDRHGLDYEDEVTFERRHVYDVMDRTPEGKTTVLPVSPDGAARAPKCTH